MEIWIAKGTKKELRKTFPFIRDFAIIDIKDIANSFGYKTSINMQDHSYYVLSSEIQKRLVSINSSKRFYRILYIVEQLTNEIAQSLLDFSLESGLTYEKVYMQNENEFQLHLSIDEQVNI